jgi:hypothetical protein
VLAQAIRQLSEFRLSFALVQARAGWVWFSWRLPTAILGLTSLIVPNWSEAAVPHGFGACDFNPIARRPCCGPPLPLEVDVVVDGDLHVAASRLISSLLWSGRCRGGWGRVAARVVVRDDDERGRAERDGAGNDSRGTWTEGFADRTGP